MKRIIFACFVGLFLISITAVAANEKEEIKEVLKNETKAFLEKDIDTWASYWLHEDYVSHTSINSFYVNQKLTWDSVYVSMKNYFEGDGDAPNLKFVGDFDIKVTGEMASAVVKTATKKFYVWAR